MPRCHPQPQACVFKKNSASLVAAFVCCVEGEEEPGLKQYLEPVGGLGPLWGTVSQACSMANWSP